ncbi:30S ribosomal protein S3ae [Candidatus Pacearchaeota archaeon]|nr:30S ribosomal protein S3ae [Candidatus Pacearchaeota archaeon]
MSKSAGRRIRDKWRLKEWYDVYTPSYFGEKNVANIPCSDPKKLIGRVVENTLYDITGDFNHQSIKLHFLIIKVEGKRASTILKGHEYSADYLRSLVRRGTSRIDSICAVPTKDDFTTRISIVTFTRRRIKASQEVAVRTLMRDAIVKKAKNLNYDQLCHEMILGSAAKAGVGSDIYNMAKKLIQLRHVGIRKSKLLSFPIHVMAKTEMKVKKRASATPKTS